MEKMGWSKGKGLGVKEDGKTENISVTLKNDTRGVGCTKSHVDNWIAHQDDFNALLANLGQDHNTGPGGSQEEIDRKVLSLEQTSRSSKGRVHYQKFTKGKDLSLKSETDLDCVFGKRKNQSGTSTPQAQSGG
ncbi:PIN2/TERF1-interacting telomerase inhibitor 1-like [Ruditapes philippinarum]|uniref:PIN2/TERF1-interacting telomerase inhibitor 1-like n=1 Tax=Ruditapes philippinarum TaxID=129788 RepID=UPI00295AD799|nr:PIN2/TERF1-interacting telomerase inhibitor 1-like [Ruditapes philippinarum]